MASARFRLGTATTNSAGTVWSWRSYDSPADIVSGSYVKVELESTNGVRVIDVSIPSADEQVVSAGTIPTVTTVQSSKTATFKAANGGPLTYIVRTQINSGMDQNGDSVSSYTSQLSTHIKTTGGKRLVAIGETDESSRLYGYTAKLNAPIRESVSSGSWHYTGVLSFSSTAQPATIPNVAQLYSSGGALLCIGGSGTITVIAPA